MLARHQGTIRPPRPTRADRVRLTERRRARRRIGALRAALVRIGKLAAKEHTP